MPILIIDALGLKLPRSPNDELLHDLIVKRHERTVSILASNWTSLSGAPPSPATRSWVPSFMTVFAETPIASHSTATTIAPPKSRRNCPNQRSKNEPRTPFTVA
ncbi:hypothethical protein (plasmid) [Ralstonia solanacearum PSI07]|nr:hypothethical protein [Ralstonia solanacearum PSI07]